MKRFIACSLLLVLLCSCSAGKENPTHPAVSDTPAISNAPQPVVEESKDLYADDGFWWSDGLGTDSVYDGREYTWEVAYVKLDSYTPSTLQQRLVGLDMNAMQKELEQRWGSYAIKQYPNSGYISIEHKDSKLSARIWDGGDVCQFNCKLKLEYDTPQEELDRYLREFYELTGFRFNPDKEEFMKPLLDAHYDRVKDTPVSAYVEFRSEYTTDARSHGVNVTVYVNRDYVQLEAVML